MRYWFKNKLHIGLTLILFGFFVLFLINPKDALESGRQAVDLCLNILLPSLLPFFVISRLLIATGAIVTMGKLFKPIMRPLFNLPGIAAFPLLAGWLSGYPAGAKYTTDLYKNGSLTLNEAQRLLFFCNNSGPLFIVGAVGTGYFGSPAIGFLLLSGHLLASLTIGITTGILSRKNDLMQNIPHCLSLQKRTAFRSHMLTDAIVDSTGTLLQISGTVIFFAVVVQSLEAAGMFSIIGRLLTSTTGLPPSCYEGIKIVLAGGMEMTYGLFWLSRTANIPMQVKILIASLLCGFGGFSVHTQVAGICSPDFKLIKYIRGKALHGLLAVLYTVILTLNRTLPVAGYSPVELHTPSPSLPVLIPYAFFLISTLFFLYRLRTRE